MQSDQVWALERGAGGGVDGNGHPVWLGLLGAFRRNGRQPQYSGNRSGLA